MFKDLIKLDTLPTSWCPGCGLGQIMIQLAMVMDELGLNYTNSTVISGVGCTGRLAGYMNVDGVYTLHGRTLPVAEAVKLVNPDLKVIVVSGDGDLASIGGNHLLHATRRNPDLTLLCNNNNVYALTGGQAGPTTPRDTKTVSSPAGAAYDPVNLQNLMKAGSRYFYAKTTVYHQLHLRNCMKEAIAWPGFAFIDIACHCIENNGRRLGFNSSYEMLQHFRRTYKRAPDGTETLSPEEIGIVRRG
ncbi:MAG TPA: thiamine pyrophosphate-dependent enzyme [Dehalococcoidia bacterium]|nr:thiamine pyrophosphate-dependent enzyme [Dehalococcoidia bacterium]